MNTPKGSMVTKDKTRMLALEMLAIDPSLSHRSLAEKLGVDKMTIASWVNDPLFIDMWYKRFMEVAGKELPNVIGAMIREALEGNVQAGRLILEHFGKLDNRVKIQVCQEDDWSDLTDSIVKFDDNTDVLIYVNNNWNDITDTEFDARVDIINALGIKLDLWVMSSHPNHEDKPGFENNED